MVSRSRSVTLLSFFLSSSGQSRNEVALLNAHRQIRGSKGGVPPPAAPSQKPTQQSTGGGQKRPAEAIQNGTPGGETKKPRTMVASTGRGGLTGTPTGTPTPGVPTTTVSPGKSYGAWTSSLEDATFAADTDTKQIRRRLSPKERRHVARTPNKTYPKIDKLIALSPPVSSAGNVVQNQPPSLQKDVKTPLLE